MKTAIEKDLQIIGESMNYQKAIKLLNIIEPEIWELDKQLAAYNAGAGNPQRAKEVCRDQHKVIVDRLTILETRWNKLFAAITVIC